MSTFRFLMPALAFAIANISSYAVADDKHHPEAASAKTSAKTAPAPTSKAVATGTDKEQTVKMDKQMKAMGEMREKMMNAKTPDEKKALMDEHMKSMHKGMSMMSGMMGKSGGKPASPEMMQKQMDMMQMMSEMMKDRMGSMAPAK